MATPHQDDSLPLGARLRRIADGALELLQNRVELLVVELQEEKERVAGLLFNLIVCALALSFGLMFFAVFLTVLLWDSARLLALGLFAAGFIALGLWAGSNVRRWMAPREALFRASREELARDRATLGDTEGPP